MGNMIKHVWDFLGDPKTELYGGIGWNPETQSKAVWQRDEDTNYVEAQIHGPLEIARDVSHVYANTYFLFGSPFFKSLYRLLVRSKIRIIWYARPASEHTRRHVCIQDNSSGEPKAVKQAWARVEREWKSTANTEKKAGYRKGRVHGKFLLISAVPGKIRSHTMGVFDECKGMTKVDIAD